MCDAVKSLLTYRLRLGKLLTTGHTLWLSYFVSESMTGANTTFQVSPWFFGNRKLFREL